MSSPLRSRFLIVGTYRSGTSAIVEAVGRHPQVLCGMEWTHRLPPWQKVRVGRAALSGDFSGLLAKHRQQLAGIRVESKSVIGFKRLFRASNKWLWHPRMAPALAVDRLGAHIRWLQSDSSIRIVHVVRQDNVAWLRSKVLADATGRYSDGQYPDEVRLSIPVREAQRRVTTKIWIDGKLAALSITNPYLRVNHEEFMSNNLGVARRIAEFLGCDPAELPETALRHQSQSLPSQAALLNSEAIRQSLGALAHLPRNDAR